ncbi:hypothetical protein D1AOALGA4SA_2953 [Olavius algarvensis Delta 1 endosymbiont]|nr:hypothetical protein D1AOALGA4SA_2953 [Olavius algarvensis Delta 1 endosymbiont]
MLLQGKVSYDDLLGMFAKDLGADDITVLLDCILNRPLRYRNRAMAILSHIADNDIQSIAAFLFVHPRTISRYIHRYRSGGVRSLLDYPSSKVKKADRSENKQAVFAVLHSPPMTYGINRTTWRIKDLQNVLVTQGVDLGRSCISRIIREAGYRIRKAKTVLTSTDPDYREKLKRITNVLSNLDPNEKFFSVDEFGPFAVKMQGGRSLTRPGEVRTVPQYQKSKGSLIITGALELSTNQMTYFYSEHKNTAEMIKLLNVLLEAYCSEKRIYFSWDAASWHASKELYAKVEEVNTSEYRKKHRTPLVELAPLPSSAQFLNVIESVFSGMARAVIHNSDYQSVSAAMAAIDRHFEERNEHFKMYPKRAGNKIWGDELVVPVFKESNNCKDPKYGR